ncbi:acetyltransferase [Sinorhizobium numidicum]|uniref:Acetyltransferase n=1 Tax=Sinorhizobium numidicum TaxID=680248 RepID=A0ABY8CVS6_9HYPH|nr:GNAT family N-acetyltransferase [Sinorhizobium numidicum]WEX75373.1 acetyltransferase [Sinorhizobium numidicum]WEX81368.1 acetyltransferase [Sinorhizobium numidicum]
MIGEPQKTDDRDGGMFRSFQLHACRSVDVRQAGSILSVSAVKDHTARFELSEGALRIDDLSTGHAWGFRLACAVFEYLFATRRDLVSIVLAGDGWNLLLPELKRRGLVIDGKDALAPAVFAEMFWQMPEIWMASPSCARPRRDIFDGKTEHPLRPPKPAGCLYARFIPWLSGTLSFTVATLEDLPDIHRWMNDPRVDEFWNEAGSEAAHRRYLDRMLADPHIIPLIGRFDEQAFSYFEIYWAKEDLIGTFCGAGDYDRGCHVIVGEGAFRGKLWFTAWLPSLLHLMFLDDPRTERIVQEPSAAHHRQLRNLQRSGFSHTRTVDLPTKRAAIMSISRQHFFSNRLWHPAVLADRAGS